MTTDVPPLVDRANRPSRLGAQDVRGSAAPSPPDRGVRSTSCTPHSRVRSTDECSFTAKLSLRSAPETTSLHRSAQFGLRLMISRVPHLAGTLWLGQFQPADGHDLAPGRIGVRALQATEHITAQARDDGLAFGDHVVLEVAIEELLRQKTSPRSRE